jgi:hypothetical protein
LRVMENTGNEWAGHGFDHKTIFRREFANKKVAFDCCSVVQNRVKHGYLPLG